MTTAQATATREQTYVGAINEAFTQLMREDPNVFIAGEDVAGSKRPLAQIFGEVDDVVVPAARGDEVISEEVGEREDVSVCGPQ